MAKLALKQLGISVTAYTSQVGPVKLDKDYKSYNLDLIETNDGLRHLEFLQEFMLRN